MDSLIIDRDDLTKLVMDAFRDGYYKAEDRQSRGDNAWEGSCTHDILRGITGAEFNEMEW